MKAQLIVFVILGLAATFQGKAQQPRVDQYGQVRVIQTPIAPISSRPLPSTNIYPYVTPAQQNQRSRTGQPATTPSDAHQQQWRENNGYHHHNNGANSSVQTYPYGYYYPYDNNPYDYTYQDTGPRYPNNYYICYDVAQTSEDSYRIKCPVPVRSYSTNPNYTSNNYNSNFKPDSYCSSNNTTDYIEFPSSYDAVTWANNNCNRDLPRQNLP